MMGHTHIHTHTYNDEEEGDDSGSGYLSGTFPRPPEQHGLNIH